MHLDPEQLRSIMRAWTAGVTIVAAAYEGEQHGMTVNSFTSVSLDPPLIIISLQDSSRTRQLVSRAGTFGVTILSEEQRELSERFAGRTPDSADRMAGLEFETLVTGAPLLAGGLAHLDCRVQQSLAVGQNTLFIAEVVAARGSGEGRPLVYHNRRYHRLVELEPGGAREH